MSTLDKYLSFRIMDKRTEEPLGFFADEKSVLLVSHRLFDFCEDNRLENPFLTEARDGDVYVPYTSWKASQEYRNSKPADDLIFRISRKGDGKILARFYDEASATRAFCAMVEMANEADDVAATKLVLEAWLAEKQEWVVW